MKLKLLVAGLLSLGLILGACARATPGPTPGPGPVATPLPTTPPPRVAATPTPPPAAVAKPEGELRVAVGYVGTEILDPIMGPGSTVKYLAELVYDYLVGATDDGKLSTKTGLAYKWERSPDAKKWTYYLRKGVKFHNGDEVTAEDAVFSIERVMSERSQSTYARNFRDNVARMETPDPYTLVFSLKEPDALFTILVSPLMGAEGMVLPKKYMLQIGEEAFIRQPIGSGPYKFKEQVFGSYVRWEAVDNHWRAGVPQFKTITVLAIPEQSTRVAALKLGQAAIIEMEKDAAKELQAAGFRIVEQPFSIDLRLPFHEQWQDIPLAKKEVRLAMLLGMDRAEIMEHIFMGKGKVGAVPMAFPSSIGYDPDLKPHPYDPERAKKLLSEAGYADGFAIDVYSFTRPGAPEAPKMMEAIASYWQKIGIRSKIIPTDYGAFRALWRAKKLSKGAASSVAIESRVWISPMHERYWLKDYEFAMAHRPDLHELVGKTLVAIDDGERERLARQVNRVVYDDVLMGTVGYISKTYAISGKLERYAPRQIPYSLSLDTAIRKK